MSLSVSEIHIYPVKSLRGVTLESSRLGTAGLAFDRQWMVVTPDGRMMTQRTHPQMVLVETAIDGDTLVLESFGMQPHRVPHTRASMRKVSSNVWGSDVSGFDLGEETAGWLSQAIGDSCRLIAYPAADTRPCDPSVSQPGDHTRYADCFPLLITTQASLDDLNGRLAQPVSMLRFRPNIVIDGCPPFAEDSWRRIVVGDVPLRVVASCARCSVPTVDPESGALMGPEPIHTLSGYRERDGEIFFGVNAAPDAEGIIRTGAPCRVDARH